MSTRTKIPTPKTIEAAREWIRDAMLDGWAVWITAEFRDSRDGCRTSHTVQYSATFMPPGNVSHKQWIELRGCRTPAELVKRFVSQSLPKILHWRECFGGGDDEPLDDDGVIDSTAIIVGQRRTAPRKPAARINGRQQAKLPAPRQPLLEDLR